MKMIRFYMSNKKEFLFSEIKARKILAHPEQIVRIMGDDDKWTGETINKAHLICTQVDGEATRQESEQQQLLPPMKPIKDISKYKPKFLHELDESHDDVSDIPLD